MQRVFDDACWRGDLQEVRALLVDSRVDPSAGNNYALTAAAYSGNWKIAQILLADERVQLQPAMDDRSLLYAIFNSGSADIVRLFLAKTSVDPSVFDNYAIRWAAVNGHVETVRVLLKDNRVNAIDAIPWAKDNCARVLAADERFGIERERELYSKHHPDLVRQYDAMICQCLTMAWVAKQLRPWSDIVWPWSDRMKAGWSEQLDV
jgi:hypothetical protein